MATMCECEICVRNRNWRDRGIPEDVIDCIFDLEMDRFYYKSVVEKVRADLTKN